MAKLTYSEAVEARQEFRKLWNKAHDNWKEWEDFYEQKHEVRFVKPAEPRKLGLARNKINVMVDTLVTRKPKVTRKPVKDTQQSKDRADRGEKWAQALLWRSALGGQNGMPPFRTAGFYLALLGYGTGAVRWDDSVWDAKADIARGPGYKRRLEEWKTSRKRAFPFLLEFPHPGRVLMPPMEKKPTIVIETASMYGWQVSGLLEQEAPESAWEFKGKQYDVVEVVQHWDTENRSLYIAGEVAEQGENGLGVVPYVHGFSGRGFEHMPSYGSLSYGPIGGDGTGMLGPKAEDMAVGHLAGITDSIRYLDEFNTAQRWNALRASYPTIYTTEDAEELQRALEKAGLGGIVTVGEPPKYEDLPNIGAWMQQVSVDARRDVDEGTFAGVVQGEVTPGVTTATQHAMQLGAARVGFDMPMTQLNLMAGEMLGLCARMVSLRGESVTIGEVTCSADDFEGNYDFEVDFQAKDEGQKLREENSGMEKFKMGLLDFEGFQDIAGVGDATGMRKRIFVDRARQSEPVQNAVFEAAMAFFRAKVAKKAREEQKVNGNQGMPPTPGQMPGFIPQPGGVQEGRQAQQGMAQVPGQGIERVIGGA